MKKISSLIFFLLLFTAIFSSCHKKSKDPAPTNTTPQTKTGLVNNTFILGGVSYSTNIGLEYTYAIGGHTYYILAITDNSSASTTPNTCEFWFNSKPAAGDYSVISFANILTTPGIASNEVMVAAFPGTSESYESQDYATTTTINVSISGNNYIVAVTNPLALQEFNTLDIKNLTTTATIP